MLASQVSVPGSIPGGRIVSIKALNRKILNIQTKFLFKEINITIKTFKIGIINSKLEI